jgi:quaternary ammonium compound-resistance protein SugE
MMPASLSLNSAWMYLFVAGLFEIVWSISMKASDGFTKHLYTVITLAAAGLSFWLLGIALRQLPVGAAYAVWTGIGAVGTAIFGVVFFSESMNAARSGCIALIVCGILGLRFLGGATA